MACRTFHEQARSRLDDARPPRHAAPSVLEVQLHRQMVWVRSEACIICAHPREHGSRRECGAQRRERCSLADAIAPNSRTI